MKYFKYLPGFIVGAASAFILREFIVLKDKDKQQQQEIAELDEKIDSLDRSAHENYHNLSIAMYENLKSLADQVGTDMHELAVLIADAKFGEEE